MRAYKTVSGHVVLLDDDVALPGRLSVGSHGYAQLSGAESGGVVLLHRWLLGLSKGDRIIGDHLDGNKMNCQRANLRPVNASENGANKAAFAGSGFRGVYPCRRRWQARCKQAGLIINLGTFDSPEEAAVVSHAWRLDNLPGYVDRPAARLVGG